MVNPYREHADRIQVAVKKLSREFLHTTPLQKDYSDSLGYLRNFVVVSGGQPFDSALEETLKETMRKVTDVNPPENM